MVSKKVVLVTGGSRGIGAATARLFAARGYRVCISYRSDAQAAAKVQKEIVAAGGECLAVQADVSVPADVERLFRNLDQQPGELSELVNNAGILHPQARLEDISVSRFEEVLRVNVLGCFLCCQAALRRMSQKNGGSGGSIVNVSSGAARTGSPNEYVDYAASKEAVDTLTRGLALEVAGEGIRVNAVRSGLMHTQIHASGGEPGRVERLRPRMPDTGQAGVCR